MPHYLKKALPPLPGLYDLILRARQSRLGQGGNVLGQGQEPEEGEVVRGHDQSKRDKDWGQE